MERKRFVWALKGREETEEEEEPWTKEGEVARREERWLPKQIFVGDEEVEVGRRRSWVRFLLDEVGGGWDAEGGRKTLLLRRKKWEWVVECEERWELEEGGLREVIRRVLEGSLIGEKRIG